METANPFYAYKETRLDLDPTTQGSIIAIRLPAHGSTSHSSRASQKRPHIAEPSIAQDERTFRERHLATAASIYYRIHHKSPRSFLWRILEDGKVLSIRAVDVSKQANTADASLTLHLRFPEAVMPGCIAFSDSKEHDVLSVFVLTESKLLYTLSLRPDYFRRPASTEDNVADWCKSYSSSVFSFKQPHRMVTLSADELFVALQDGSLLKLERNSGGDGKKFCS
jgi:nuclear pore complex protein Nup160